MQRLARSVTGAGAFAGSLFCRRAEGFPARVGPCGAAGPLWARVSALLRVSSVRYAILGLAAVAVLIAAMTQMASVIVDQWSQRDVELRARLVFRSIHERVVAGLAAKATGADLKPFF